MQKPDHKIKIVGIIPARFASTRFPGKPLVEIQGKSMIQRVYEQCCKSNLQTTIVATDDQRIKTHVEAFGGKVVMTKSTHQTGTDRCAEVAEDLLEAEVILNVQGDEPFIDPSDINKVIALLVEKNYQIATLAMPIEDPAIIQNENVVKVVFAKNQQALYFSRSSIPFVREGLIESSITLLEASPSQKLKPIFHKHIGLYGFQKSTLLEISKLPQSTLEKTESLEQLRWLENGYHIGVDITTTESLSVDTPEDLSRINKNFNS